MPPTGGLYWCVISFLKFPLRVSAAMISFLCRSERMGDAQPGAVLGKQLVPLLFQKSFFTQATTGMAPPERVGCGTESDNDGIVYPQRICLPRS